MKLSDYPLTQYVKNGKVEIAKVVNDASVNNISDHILVHLLLHICVEQRAQITQLKSEIKKALKNKSNEQARGTDAD
jgi:hypothetical protein